MNVLGTVSREYKLDLREGPSTKAPIGKVLSPGSRAQLIERTGDGPVFYTVAVEYDAYADKIPAVPGSVAVSREYYVIERAIKGGQVREKRKPLKGTLKPGDDDEVVLTVNSPYDFDYVVVGDPKVAGFINLDDHSGYNGAAGAYVELWNHQRNMLFERLPAGKTVLRYRIRAEIPGTYTARPARVYGMYSPDIGSSTASATITIAE